MEALVNAFDSPNILEERKSYGRLYRKEVDERERDLASALKKMVKSYSETGTTLDSKKKWTDWWATHKDTAQFITPPVHTYE